MIVFKTILKILNKLKGLIILYTIMLVSVTAINQTSNNVDSFEEIKPSVVIVNNDKSESRVTNHFVKYLENHMIVKDIDVDDEEKIDDALFYRDVSLVVYIPNGFGKDLLDNKDVNVEYKISGDKGSSYGKMLVQNYFDTFNIYNNYYDGDAFFGNIDNSLNLDMLFGKLDNALNLDINVEVKSKIDTNSLSRMARFFNFLNYAILAGCVYSISMILASLKSENVRKRTIVSSYNYKKYNRIVLASCSIVIIGMWILYMILALIIFKDLFISMNGLWYAINSFVFSLCSLCIGFLIGNITQNKGAISGIVNVVSLGSSFLCGCFVPFEFMPDYVIKIAHIFPTYYFVINNEALKVMDNFSLSNVSPLIFNMGIVLIFAMCFVIITNYVSKKKQVLN